MKFTSNWNHGGVFWRTFVKNDTVYLIGLMQGTIYAGETAEYNNPTNYFQMELKRGDLFGPALVAPGHVYQNSDEYILTVAGDFLSVEDAATVSVDPGGVKVEPAGQAVVQFFSQGSADSSITITSTVVQTETQGGTSQSTVSSEATDENGAQVGAKETAGGGSGKIGVELSESASTKVTSKISNVVATTLNFSVSTQTTYTESQPVVLKANKLTAIKSSWQRRYFTGTVALDTLHLTWDATVGYVGSRAISEFDSPDLLPPDLMSAYVAQNPGYLPPGYLKDGAVLREKDSAPVYVIFGGAKFWVPSPAVLDQLYGGWGSVVVVADGSLSAVPTVPRDGTLLREQNHPEVWMIEAGDKRHIVSPDVLSNHGGWTVVHLVPDDSTASFPEGAPVTT